jgi:hypothetical protein
MCNLVLFCFVFLFFCFFCLWGVNPRVVYFMYYFVNILLVLVAMAMLDFFLFVGICTK